MHKFLKLFQPQQSKPVVEKTMSKTLTKEQENILKGIRKNRRVIAEDIFLGELSYKQLVEKHGMIPVEEMKRTIAAARGNPWVCKACESI